MTRIRNLILQPGGQRRTGKGCSPCVPSHRICDTWETRCENRITPGHLCTRRKGHKGPCVCCKPGNHNAAIAPKTPKG